MAKFKVGDRVVADGKAGVVRDINTLLRCQYLVEHDDMDFNGHNGNCLSTVAMSGNRCWWYQDEDLEPVAVAPATATATLTIEAGKFYKTRDGRKVGPMVDYPDSCRGLHPFESEGFIWQVDGTNYDGADSPHTLIAEWVDEPATPAPITVNLDLEFIPFPQVGDAVLIPGVISAINQSPRGTNYNIVFETQNRRMSLHFLEEDFILDECGDDDGSCPCANDNGPVPTGDTAKAFDALGDWLRAVAINPSAAFRSNKEAA